MKSLFTILLLGVSVMAQDGKAPKPVPQTGKPSPALTTQVSEKLPPGLTISEASYPLPTEDKAKIREIQYQIDQMEIATQQMLVKVEQNRAKEAELWNAIRGIGFEYAQKKSIPLDQYTMDAGQLSFIKNKPTTTAPVAK